MSGEYFSKNVCNYCGQPVDTQLLEGKFCSSKCKNSFHDIQEYVKEHILTPSKRQPVPTQGPINPVTTTGKYISPVLDHNQNCKDMLSNLVKKEIKAISTQRPIPDLIIIKDGNFIGIEYENNLNNIRAWNKVAGYKNSSYNFVLVVNKFKELLFKRTESGTYITLKDDEKEYFKEILECLPKPIFSMSNTGSTPS